MKDSLSWQDVFYPHKKFGWISEVWGAAMKAGYPYFCWNELIFITEGGKQTGKTIHDVK